MTQLFRDTEFNVKFDAWVSRNKNLQSAMAWRFSDEITTSKMYGEFIWDNDLSDIAPFFSREYFANNFPAIIAAFEVAGTFESYLTIIRSALGDSTAVTFSSPNPSHLIIGIAQPTGIETMGSYTQNALLDTIPDQVQYGESVLAFARNVTGLTINETVKLIELLNVNGVFVEVNFV